MSDKKVLLVSVDGMRPDGLKGCGDSFLEEFYKKGTYSFKATTVYPSITLPCHMSLFHSVDPDRHGVRGNDFVPQNHPIKGLIEVLDAAGKSTSVFYMWEQLRDLWRPSHVSYTWFKSWSHDKFNHLDEQVTKACDEYLSKEHPDFAFLYLGEVDEWGHYYGWMGPEYLEGIKTAGQCIKHMAQKFGDEYDIIITADHGGHGRNHGDDTPEDMTIPIAFVGKDFDQGKELDNLSILDIAPTIADLLSVNSDPDWEGKSIL